MSYNFYLKRVILCTSIYVSRKSIIYHSRSASTLKNFVFFFSSTEFLHMFPKPFCGFVVILVVKKEEVNLNRVSLNFVD